MLGVRVVSDSASTPLPVPFAEWFDMRRQRPRKLGLLSYLVRHPDRAGPFADFIRGLGPARRALADLLLRIVKASSASAWCS